MPSKPIDAAFARTMRGAWFAYLDTVEPIRPELHRYCLKLTGEIWSAEDLVQDALLKGFASLGRGDMNAPGSAVASPKAWLFRVASNLWIDQMRRSAREAALAADEPAPPLAPDVGVQIKDAGARLLAIGSPQERAALLLKDAFDFKLEEIAEMLGTSVGAVKSALHRGRAKLHDADAEARPAVSRALVDRFVAAFNAHDVAAATALMLENITIEVLGVGGGRGPQNDWTLHTLGDPDERFETRLFADEPIIVHFKGEGAARRTHTVTRIEEADGRVSRIRDYCFCPETIAAVCAALGLAAERPGYRPDGKFLDDMVAATPLPWR